MSSKNLTIDLKAQPDQNGQTYYVGKIKAPVLIDCSKGVCFFVFTSELNGEQIQIAMLNDKDI